jgi:serine/threonine protein kinase
MRHEGRTAAKKPGTLICGKWRVERTVRVTEQLASYVATDPSGARVYVKVLHPYKAGDAPLVARLKREAYVVNRIKHPAIVRVLGDGETDEGSVAIALELVEGDTLEEYRIKRGGLLPPDEVVKIGAQICDALAAAHDQGVIHRDMRPESFMITKSGEIRVPEFAAARVLGEQVEERERTAAGTTLGSPSYMSPEQARGQRDRIDKRSDVFGLGATLYALLSGKTVHPADNPLAALLAASRNRAKPVRTVVRGELPDVLAAAVDKALAFEPTDRHIDMRAFKKALGAEAPAGRPAGSSARTQQSVAPPAAPTKAAPTQASPSMSPPAPVRSASMPPPPLGQGLPQRGFNPTQGPLARPSTSGVSSPKAPLPPRGSQPSPAMPTQASPQVAAVPMERKDSRPPKPELPRSAPDNEITALLQPGMVPAPMAPPMPQGHPSYPPPQMAGYGQQPYPAATMASPQMAPQMGQHPGYPSAPSQGMGGYGGPQAPHPQGPGGYPPQTAQGQQGSGGYPAQGPQGHQGHPYGGQGSYGQIQPGMAPQGMAPQGMASQGYGQAYGAPPQGQGYGASQSGGYAAQGMGGPQGHAGQRPAQMPGPMSYGANPGFPQGGFPSSPSNPPPAFPGATPPMPGDPPSRTGLYLAMGGCAVLVVLALVYAFAFMGR